MSAADDAREKLEAAIWPHISPGRHEHGRGASGRAVSAILSAAEKFADAKADERINRMTPDQWRARLRLAEATAEADGTAS